MYKEFIIKGTAEEIEEFIELMENKNSTVSGNTVSINLDNYDKCSSIEEDLEKYSQNQVKIR